MSGSLLLTCCLNEQQLPRFVFLREDNGVDGSFLISSILGQRLKQQDTGTVLLCLQHSFQHYSSAGIRLGYNLNVNRDKGALIALEPLLDLAENLFKSNYLSNSDEEILQSLWQQIEQSVVRLMETKHSITLIVDNLSCLIDFGIDEYRIIELCQRLSRFNTERLSVVVKINTCQLFEDICNNLEDLAEVEIKIEKLKSGNFREVDGRIVCLNRNANGYDKTEKTVLYKVNDRNVRVFAPGEVGVKA